MVWKLRQAPDSAGSRWEVLHAVWEGQAQHPRSLEGREIPSSRGTQTASRALGAWAPGGRVGEADVHRPHSQLGHHRAGRERRPSLFPGQRSVQNQRKLFMERERKQLLIDFCPPPWRSLCHRSHSLGRSPPQERGCRAFLLRAAGPRSHIRRAENSRRGSKEQTFFPDCTQKK